MHILSITTLPPPFGGVTVLVEDLLLALAQTGIRQSVVTQRRYDFEVFQRERAIYTIGSDAHADLRDRGIAVHPLYDYTLERRSERRGPRDVDDDLYRRLCGLIDEDRPDLISCQFPSGAFREAAMAAREAAIPFVLTLHGMTNLVAACDSLGLRGLSPDELIDLIRESSHAVVVSHEMLEYCRDHGLQNVSLIHGGVNLDVFRPDPEVARSGVLYVGRTLDYKGLRQVCEAYLMVERELADPLVLVGCQIDRASFDRTGFSIDERRRARFADLMDQGRVRLLGEVRHDQIMHHHRRARVFVLPSLTEGLPITILEALACGTPVIASDVGAVSEVVIDGETGYVTPKGDVEAVARALASLPGLGDAELAARCRESVRRFSIERACGQYVELFRDLIRT